MKQLLLEIGILGQSKNKLSKISKSKSSLSGEYLKTSKTW
jgi:hypothetical protein